MILCPVNPSAASAHGESRYWGYTAAFNALDLPGSVFPVSTVKDTDALSSNEPILSERDQEYRGFYAKGGPAKYRDAPIALQLVGKRFQEEKLLAMTELVQDTLAKAKFRVESVVGAKSLRPCDMIPAHWGTGYDMQENVPEMAGERLVRESMTA